MESSLIALPAQMHFSIPHVPLLANTLIINGSGNVHSQELLVLDAKQSSVSYLVMSENNVFDVGDKNNTFIAQVQKGGTKEAFFSCMTFNHVRDIQSGD